VFREKCFHNTSFLVAVMFHGLRVHLVSAVVITSDGDIVTVVFLSKYRPNEALKQRVKEEIAAILEQMTRQVMENRRGRLEKWWGTAE
jgi:folate-dependent phosphoribosylglycinamide formyltransferase PurN